MINIYMIDIVEFNQIYKSLDLDSVYIFIQTLSYLFSRILFKFNRKTLIFCN